MWLEAAGLAAGIGGKIFGGIQSAKAAREKRVALGNEKDRLTNMFNKNYYQDYLSRSDAQRAMKRVEDSVKRRNQAAASTAAITGATPEQQVAIQQANSEAIGNTMEGIQANADNYKAQIEAQHNANMSNITAREMNLQAEQQLGAGNLMQTAGEVVAGTIANTGVTNTPQFDPLADAIGKMEGALKNIQSERFPNEFGY